MQQACEVGIIIPVFQERKLGQIAEATHPIFSVWWSLAWSLSVWLQIELFGMKLQKYFVSVKNLQFLEDSLRAS